ncbi:MAG TPA: dienelactone hydrolase family protein [Vicinamibacterales bacterium]|jgi:carboxymethylenebutenolidase
MLKVFALAPVVLFAAASAVAQTAAKPSQDVHADHMMMDMGQQAAPAATAARPDNPAIPPADAASADRLKGSSRHGEWIDIKMPAGPPLRSFVVYPERSDKAPVVLVIHDIFGMGDWARAVGDSLARDGFIAVVPDLLSGKGPNGGGSEELGQNVGQAIRTLTPDDVNARLNAAAAYGRSLPSANGQTAVIGFCWGGSASFNYAIAQPDLFAAVVYYGTPPTKAVDGKQVVDPEPLARIKAPIIGFYGGNDARVTSTVEPTTAEMKKLAKVYEPHVEDGAGHGFLKGQAQSDANAKAALDAWPLTIAFLKKYSK